MTLIITTKTITAVFWHNGFATHWSISEQCDLFNEANKHVFLTVAMLSLISLCVIVRGFNRSL